MRCQPTSRALALMRRLAVDAELSVALVDDDEMHRLNATYRRIDRPTDVLAFAAREGAPHPAPVDVLGDVVISLDQLSDDRGPEQSPPPGDQDSHDTDPCPASIRVAMSASAARSTFEL